MTRRTAANIIAFHFCQCQREMSDHRYQPTRYSSPAVYDYAGMYLVAPSDNRMPKYDFGGAWYLLAEHYGRKIWAVDQ